MPALREYHGRVLSVTEQHIGATLTQDESSGATTLHVSDVDWTSGDGGDNDIYIHRGKEHNTYNSVNDGASTIHLTSGTTQAYPEGTIVEPWNPDTRTRWAEVRLEGSEYEDSAVPVIVHVPGHLVNMMPLGTRHGNGERVWVRHDNRWRLFVHRIVGVNGNTALWLYQTTPDITSSAQIHFRPPYDATLFEVRCTAEDAGSADTICNVRHETVGIINDHDITIKNGKKASEWIKIGGDDGRFIEDDERINCTVDTIGAGVTGPIHFEFRVQPKGAG